VALAVELASSFTSLATTAKPLPSSPARAASIVALRARRLVCSAIDEITPTTVEISALDTPRRLTMSPVCAATVRASLATALASAALRLISPMLSRSSLTPRATLAVFSLRRLPVLDTVPAWAAEPSALEDIVRLTDVNSSAALASCVAVVFTWASTWAIRSALSRCARSRCTCSVASTQFVW